MATEETKSNCSKCKILEDDLLELNCRHMLCHECRQHQFQMASFECPCCGKQVSMKEQSFEKSYTSVRQSTVPKECNQRAVERTPRPITRLESLVDFSLGKVATSRLSKPVTKFTCSRRHVYALAITPEEHVFMVSKVTRKMKEDAKKLTVWRSDGKKLINQKIQMLFVSIALAGDTLFIADRTAAGVQYTDQRRTNFQSLTSINLRQPVLSKPAPGEPVYVIGKNADDEYNIMRIKSGGSGDSSGFTIVHLGNICSFDVSKDETFCAVVSRDDALCINVYKLNQPSPYSGFVAPCECGDGDVCFYTSSGSRAEVLLVADYSNHRIVMLDHKNQCKVLGETEISYPARIARDKDGRLWAVSDWIGKRDEMAQVVMFPSDRK